MANQFDEPERALAEEVPLPKGVVPQREALRQVGLGLAVAVLPPRLRARDRISPARGTAPRSEGGDVP